MSAAAEPLRQRILEERDGAVLIVTIDCHRARTPSRPCCAPRWKKSWNAPMAMIQSALLS